MRWERREQQKQTRQRSGKCLQKYVLMMLADVNKINIIFSNDWISRAHESLECAQNINGLMVNN
jgi:hypothetical protein